MTCASWLINATPPAAIDQALQTFAATVESAVDSALRQQQDPVRHPHRCLAKSYWGRCQPRHLVKREVPCMARPDIEVEGMTLTLRSLQLSVAFVSGRCGACRRSVKACLKLPPL